MGGQKYVENSVTNKDEFTVLEVAYENPENFLNLYYFW